ncbi:DUF4352 domain-containing protein [Populibacterium corticicola]|uniref:DUF4352 domain-containing protein n=1 Tax=Populibacterium corticicola TaxID=1812826 RepID=A0ABW5XE50_9MICO
MGNNPFDPPQNFNSPNNSPQGPQPGQQPSGYPQQPPVGYPPQQFQQSPVPPQKEKNWFARHKILTVIFALIAIVVIANLSGGEGEGNTPTAPNSSQSPSPTDNETQADNKEPQEEPTETETPDEEPATQEPEPEPEPEPTGFKIGDVAEAGDMTYKVLSAKTAQSVGESFLAEKAKGTYLVVELEVTNNSNDSSLVTSSFFKLKQGEKVYEADSVASLVANSADGNDSFLGEDLNPDLTMKGVVVFDVPEKVAKAKDNLLQAQTGFWGTQTVDILLAR